MPLARVTTVVVAALVTAVTTGSGLASNFATPPTLLQVAFVIISVLTAAGLAAHAEIPLKKNRWFDPIGVYPIV